jgi:hypothetical protein
MAREDYDGGFSASGTGAAAKGIDQTAISSLAQESQTLGAAKPTRGVPGADGGIADILTKQDFFDQNQITLQNPYGSQGIMTRMFGINPSTMDYSDQISEQSRRNIMNLAYDRYRNPYAKYNILGEEVGGDKETGEVRYGLASLGSSPTTFLGDVVKVPLPKSSQRSIAELLPVFGGITRILPQETMKMIEAESLPGGIPTAAQGREKYEASKREGTFLENIMAALSGESDERR